ncbi:MAG: class I SAM-dependent methyltransferase [Phycisphaeraceae bacterium]|nr:class I SAM-dependent methyltransferase [Phycisphaerales bacterium]MCB9861472.1 class I SAM-dependent methyltransferase [Phycisphaeraceae bacterium]
MAQDYVNTAAMDLIRSLPDYRSCACLELGCGDGHMLETLARDGVDVRGTTFRSETDDYIRYREHPQDIASRIDTGIDLNSPLPYEDNRFDLVYSVEVIEHVEGHRNFISEAARVLKPNGTLVLTTPNVHRLSSRLRFLLSGIPDMKREPVPADVPLNRMEEYHHRCVDFPTLHYLLWRSGLRIEEMRVTKTNTTSRVAMALYGLLVPYTKSACQRRASSDEDKKAKRDLTMWMLSKGILFSEQLCIRATKVHNTDQSHRESGASASRQTSSHTTPDVVVPAASSANTMKSSLSPSVAV